MATQEQVLRWRRLNPTAAHNGRIFEIPMSQLTPRVGIVIAVAAAGYWANQAFLHNKKAETLDPEWQAEDKKIGNVAQRMNAPPVFLNPFRHRVPGNISGPEDVDFKA